MTLAAGLVNSGFTAPTQAQILADLQAQVLATINSSLDLGPEQVLGQLLGIFAEELAEAYQVVATLYNALNPNFAEGQLLVNDCALVGVVPQAATYSQCTVNFTIATGTTLPAGFQLYVTGQPSNIWVLNFTITNFTGSSQTAVGTFRSLNTGVFTAPPGTLTQQVITTPGVSGFANSLASTPGNLADTDTSLRGRRAAELSGEGASNIDSIRTQLLEVPGVLSVIVTENTSLTTATDGTPGKAFHVIIWDGPSFAATNNSLAQAIWNSKAAGIQSYGVSSGTALDSNNVTHTVPFDRATQEPIYLQFTTTPSSLSTSQTLAIKNAVLAYANGTFDGSGNQLTPPNASVLGQSVVALTLRASALVPGVVTDVPTMTLNIGSYGSNTANIAITATQIATFSLGNILVNGL